MHARLIEILNRFEEDPQAAVKALRTLALEDRGAFVAAAIQALRDRIDAAGHRALAGVLAERDLLADPLCDPRIFTRERAIEVARAAVQAQPLLDAHLARRLSDLEPEGAQHVLAILDTIAEGRRVVSLLRPLLRGSDPRLRSKATLLVGRAIQNPDWLEELLQHEDPRVRANAVEALWGAELDGIREHLLRAADDPHRRVKANALVGLHRFGDPGCLPRLRQLAMCPGSPERASAAWALGETRDPRFLPLLRRMNPDPAGQVGRHIERAIQRLEQSRAAVSPRLAILPLGRERLPDGSARLELLLAPEPPGLLDLKPTHFVVWEGEEPVEKYTVVARERSRPLILGFVLCGGADLSDRDLEAGRAAVLERVSQKRSLDAWAVVHHVDQPVRFITDKSAFRREVQRVDERGLAPAKSDVIQRLVEQAARLRGDRHLIVLAGPQGIPAGVAAVGRLDPTQLAAAARAAECAIHAVILGDPPRPHPTQDLCSRTGGVFTRAPTTADLGAAYAQVCGGLLNRYQVCYQALRPGERVRLEVLCDQGRGEVLLPAEDPTG